MMVSFRWWTVVLVVSSSSCRSISVTADTSTRNTTTSGRVRVRHPHHVDQDVLHVVHVPTEDDAAVADSSDSAAVDDDDEDTTFLRVPKIITNSSFHVDHRRNMVEAVPPYYVEWFDGLCGGSLIGPDLVLTSTQCYNILYDNLGKVVIGGGKFTRKVIDVIPHYKYYEKNFAQTKQFDLLLLKLKYPIWNKNYIIDLNLKDTTIPNKGDILTTTTTSSGSSSGSSSVIMVEYIPNWKCQKHSPYYDNRIKKNALCTTASIYGAVSSAATSTNNDNDEAEAVLAPTCEKNLKGSPLVLQTSNGKEVQVGIASWSDGEGCDVPRVYTRISGFKKWIKTQGCLLSTKKPDFCPSS